MSAKRRLNVMIVLDRSGSMSGSEKTTVGAVNEYLSSLSQNESADAYVTLKMFDSEGIDSVLRSVPANKASFAREQYVPRSMTPLLDAVGDGIESLDEAIAEGELAALVVLTDGQENCSRNFSKEDIRRLLGERQQAGWLVIFLGADIDAWEGARDIGIAHDRSLSFSKSKMPAMSMAVSELTRRFVDSGKADLAIFDDKMRDRAK
jgi:Mg-chelatase subunit ChlD